MLLKNQVIKWGNGLEKSQAKSYYPDVADLIEVLIDTGMRRIEFLELMYKDVNFESNLILIRVTKGNGHRRIPMTKRVATILKRRQEHDQQKPFNLNEMQISMAWNWTRDQIGLRNDREFVLHALRRTCGYRLFNAGVELEIVQDWLGYSRVRIKRLAPLPLKKLAHAAKLLEEWLK
jgi:integrase